MGFDAAACTAAARCEVDVERSVGAKLAVSGQVVEVKGVAASNAKAV